MAATSDVAKNAYNSALSVLDSTQAAYNQANSDYLESLNNQTDGAGLDIDESSYKLLAQY